MAEPLTFDPELEGLLQEIAADPDSRLLRLPRATTLPDLLAIPDPVSPARAGLSAAERHLLEVHREELADVLRRACLVKFFSGPQEPVLLNRSITAGTELSVESEGAWAHHAEQALRAANDSQLQLDGMELLEACLHPDGFKSVTIPQLARTSQLLHPSDSAQAYVGLDLVLSGRPSPGVSAMNYLLNEITSPLVRSCVLENMALAHSTLGALDRARHYYRQAVEACEQRPSAHVGWLLASLLSGHRTEAMAASQDLDEVCSDSWNVIRDLTCQYRRQRESGIMTVVPYVKELSQSILDRVGQLSREVASVLLD